MGSKYCCLIVTYNRKELLVRCIENCLKQNLNPDIFIFDNASTDNTKVLLEEKGYLNFSKISYYKSNKNLGGAGGFSNGLKMCVDRGYDFIWMMDDDGYPRKESTFEECIEAYNKLEGNVIVNSMVYAENEDLSFRIADCDTLLQIKNKYQNTDIIIGSGAPFNGTLVTGEIVKKIGYPREDFFIKGDEFEYISKAKVNGINLVTAIKADFYHPRFIVKKKKILFKEININNEPAWKEYCRARNYVYIYKKYYGKKQLIRHYIVSLIKCLFYSEDKKRKIKATIAGLVDGRKNIFSNDNVMKFR